jgi:mRNA-degrading endonuclease toxin of MazEF toxin-antitoxin module
MCWFSSAICGLVVRLPAYRFRGPGSIPGWTRFSHKQRVWNGFHSASLSTVEKLLEKKSSGSGLEIREYCRRDPSRWPRGTLYLQKLALASPTGGFRSVGIVRSRTKAAELCTTICRCTTSSDKAAIQHRVMMTHKKYRLRSTWAPRHEDGRQVQAELQLSTTSWWRTRSIGSAPLEHHVMKTDDKFRQSSN